MIFFICGTDQYRVNEKLNELKSGFISKKDKAGLNVIILNGENLDLDSFKQEALTAPFLSAAKLIIVKNLLAAGFNQRKLQEEIAAFLQAREKNLQNNLVFADVFEDSKKIPIKNNLFLLLERQKFSWMLNELKGRELDDWLKRYLEKNKIKLDPLALKELILLVGNNLGQIVLELEKLSHYRQGQLIKRSDVIELVKAKFDENIFNLTDALGTRNQTTALKLLRDQLEAGNAPLAILPMIERQFKILLRLKSILENYQGYPNRFELAKELGLHEFVVQKALKQVKNFSGEQLKKIYSDLLELEKKFKTGAKNPELYFDLFVIKNC